MSNAKPKSLTRKNTKQLIERALRKVFPKDTVDISDGYKDNIHVLVVSRQFDQMTEPAKQAMLWKIIDGEPALTKKEKLQISLLMPLSPSEIK